MARESYPHILAADLGEKLAVGDIAVETHLVIFDFRLSGRHRRVRSHTWRRAWRNEAGHRLRRRGQRDLPSGLRQSRTHFVGTKVDFSRRLASFLGVIQMLKFF